MNLLSVLLVLFCSFQVCYSASTEEIIALSPCALEAKLGTSPVETSQNQGYSSDESCGTSPLMDTQLLCFNTKNDETIARKLFEKVVFAEHYNQQRLMQKEFVQLMQLVQDECKARALFEKVALVLYQKEQQLLRQSYIQVRQQEIIQQESLRRASLQSELLKELVFMVSIKNAEDFINCPTELWPTVHPKFKKSKLLKILKVLFVY